MRRAWQGRSVRTMKRSYAVVWASNGDRRAGRLEAFPDHFELQGREAHVSIRFDELEAAAIERGRDDRLLDLPVLALELRGHTPLRIASLEGAGFLQELADRLEAAGRTVAAA